MKRDDLKEKVKGYPCGANLESLKKRKEEVRFSISYRIPGGDGEQRMEFAGYSVKEARDADGKRKVQKRENKFVFDIKPEAKLTFDELTEWYLCPKSKGTGFIRYYQD